MSTRLPLGAPGVYAAPRAPSRALAPTRMDVCAFVGVAPRGPCRVPVVDARWPDDRPTVEPDRPRRRSVAVAVESWSEYRRLYGAFEGPGLLPFAVRSYFQQGGRRAYIVRVVPAATVGARASGSLAGVHVFGSAAAPRVTARDEGAWGNALRVETGFVARPVTALDLGPSGLSFDAASSPPAGALLRARTAAGVHVFRVVTLLREVIDDHARRVRVATLDAPLPAGVEEVEMVELTLTVTDGVSREVHDRVGLSSLHPRWLATVLCRESSLLWPDAAWSDGALMPDDPLLPARARAPGDAGAPRYDVPLTGGDDDYAAITHDDFFDPAWMPGEGEARDGVYAVESADEVATLVVPDLYDPRPEAEVSQAPRREGVGRFVPCEPDVPESPAVVAERLTGLRLDPTDPVEFARIVALQQAIVRFAEATGSMVALLDVPPGLHARQVLRWRDQFRSAYAAGYHPWLKVQGEGVSADALVWLNPSAVAAGVIAMREHRDGIPHGPANERAVGVLGVLDRVTQARHDALHQSDVNVYVVERDGVWLTAARTLSRDPPWRQLSVRRLMIQLRRVLEQQTWWMVFEPNTPSLRAEIRHMIRSLLRQLFAASAFRGATEEESFFVRCDEALNPPSAVDQGRLVVEVGVAPAEPLEFIVLRVVRDVDGNMTVEG